MAGANFISIPAAHALFPMQGNKRARRRVRPTGHIGRNNSRAVFQVQPDLKMQMQEQYRIPEMQKLVGARGASESRPK